METRPLISVIVPCYNQAQFLPDALQSILNQSYNNWECIIVNDGSPDDTESVAQEWCGKDERFKYLNKKNEGVSAARNAGIRIATGEYILPLDGDDKISSNYIEQCVKAFEKNPQTKLVYGKAVFFGEQQGEWNLPDFNYHKFLMQNLIYCTAMYRKSGWEKAGGYDEQMHLGFEDWEFWLRLISPEDVITRLHNILFYYRIKITSRNTDLNASEQKMQQVYNYVYRKHSDKMNAVIGNPIDLYFRLEGKKKDWQEIERGAKVWGIFGRLMFGILRKTGHIILNKENKRR